MTKVDKFHENVSTFWSLRPQNPTLEAFYIIVIIFKYSWKIKKVGKIFIFSRIFSKAFKFLLMLMHIFEKLRKILGLFPVVNFRSDPRKSIAQTFVVQQNRKIPHKFLFNHGRQEWTCYLFPCNGKYYAYFSAASQIILMHT